MGVYSDGASGVGSSDTGLSMASGFLLRGLLRDPHVRGRIGRPVFCAPAPEVRRPEHYWKSVADSPVGRGGPGWWIQVSGPRCSSSTLVSLGGTGYDTA